jgi:ectoine hydroxylase-related dioxygenase (phytanoyl-CoA dioxygenase family)
MARDNISTNAPLGWNDIPSNDPGVVKLRQHLQTNSGIKGQKILQPPDIEQAVELFRRDGFVVIENILNDEQIDFLATGCNEVIQEITSLDNDSKGNRGSHRYSFGGSSMTRSQLHRPEWQMLLEIPEVIRLVNAVFGSEDYILRAASGDFCLPGAVDYQPLHSDVGDWIDSSTSPFSSFFDPRGQVSLRDLPPPYVCVNFLPQDVTRINGATRQIPGTQNSRGKIPSLQEEPEWMRLSTVCPAPAGSIMIRDVRAWHGGTPNVSDTVRSIPNLEFYAPWFREPILPGITYNDYRKLSERAQRLAKFCVADSSEELVTGPTLRAP